MSSEPSSSSSSESKPFVGAVSQNGDGEVPTGLTPELIKECNDKFDEALKDPYVKFVMDAMGKMGCNVNRSFFRCQSCMHSKVGGGFQTFSPTGDPKDTQAQIIACADSHIYSPTYFRNMVNHELIHAYDYCRSHLNTSGNLDHHACTEIRAANLSRECYFSTEFFTRRNYHNIRKQHQHCVRRRATLSVASNPLCNSKEEAEAAVDRVFDECFNDTAPFERIP